MARPRKFDEAKVLDAAAEQFRTAGFTGTSMDDLLAATGLGKGSLYGAFGDKQQLFRRIFDGVCTESVRDLREALEGPDAGALERLTAVMRGNAIACATPGPGCLLAKGTAELEATGAEVACRARETYAGMEAALQSAIEAGQRAGDVRPGVDARAQAGLLLALMRGNEALGRAGVPEAELLRTADAAIAGISA